MNYYWNTKTNATTSLGAPRPETWVEVSDPKSGSTYWWNPETNATTAIGALRPSDVAQRAHLSPHVSSGSMQGMQPPSLGSSMLMYGAMGFGMSVSFALVRFMLG